MAVLPQLVERLVNNQKVSNSRFDSHTAANELLMCPYEPRWSPRGCPWPRGRPRVHILKSLTSKPQVLENCLVLGSRTALFFEWLKFCRSTKKCFSWAFFFFEIAGKNFLETFLWKTLAFVSLASNIPVFSLGPGFFFVSLASSLVSSTPPC